MAVSFTGVRVADAESLSPTTPVAGEWEDMGGGGRMVLDADTKYQGDYGVTYKVKTSETGVNFTPNSTTYDITSGPKIFLYKGICIVAGAIGTTRATGLKFEMGSGATAGGGQPSDYFHWYIATNTTYPPTTNWLILPIDGNEIAWIDLETGTVSKTAINYWGVIITLTVSTVKTENTGQDAIDYLTTGTGLSWTGANGDFQAFITFDQGTPTNRYGVVTTGPKGEVLYINGTLLIGSTVATTFDDANRILIFPAGFVGEGFFGINWDVNNGSSAFTLLAITFKSLGIAKKKHYFDTIIDIGTNTIQIDSHDLEDGDYIIYSKEGGSKNIGLTDATGYWVEQLSDDAFYLHTSRINAFLGTSRVTISPSSIPAENHSIVRDLDTRADHSVSSTSGTCEFTACSFDGVRLLTLSSAATIIGGFLLRAGNVSAGTATITGLKVTTQTTEEGEALFTPLTTLNNITECIIEAGDDGHFAELTATGTFTSNNTYTGFWAPATDGWKFLTDSGVGSGTETITFEAAHGLVSGDAVYYNKEGGTDSIGLTDGQKYYAHLVSATAISLHVTAAEAIADTRRIDLTGSGGEPEETHSLYSANATIFNDSGGEITLNIAAGSTIPSIRNGSGATTIISIPAVDATQKVTTSAGVAINGARVFLKASDDTGPFPFEESITMIRSGGTVTVTHTAHGMTTGDKVVIYGAAEHEYNGIRSITVTNDDTYTFTIGTTPDSPATGSPTSTFIVLSGLTDVNGEITMNRVFNSDQPFTGWARLSTSSPYYKSGPINGIVDSADGYSGTVSLVLDE